MPSRLHDLRLHRFNMLCLRYYQRIYTQRRNQLWLRSRHLFAYWRYHLYLVYCYILNMPRVHLVELHHLPVASGSQWDYMRLFGRLLQRHPLLPSLL